jgi:hypothetical protein
LAKEIILWGFTSNLRATRSASVTKEPIQGKMALANFCQHKKKRPVSRFFWGI